LKKGSTQTPERRANISKALKGRVFTSEHRTKLGNARRGQRHSPETRAKLSRLFSGRKQPQEEIDRRKKAMKRVCRAPVGVEGPTCECCGRSTFGVLSQDHNHETGGLRGKLCYQCNRGLGLFEDSPELLEKAASYLRQYL
jgi:hypothetical protein